MEIINFNGSCLSIFEVSDFLNKNENKFTETQKPIKCLSRTLPCMCFSRDKDCLFLDVYQKLSEKYSHFSDEKYLEQELFHFYKIETAKTEVQKWLIKNLQIGFSKYSWFSTATKYANLRLSFINGKISNEFDYIKFEINGNDFKNNYDFALLFWDLFFDQELLPNELAKWKYENEIRS